MNLAKIKAVVEWLEPRTRKQLQRFWGFAHFYIRFIHDFSCVALLLTCLSSPKVSFQWSPVAQQAFTQLKQKFASTPILIQPDLSEPFIVEVDASDSGVGALLSQHSRGKLHPCAFLSCRLSRAERNYDVEDQELLAIKLALEEWRHLDGPQKP